MLFKIWRMWLENSKLESLLKYSRFCKPYSDESLVLSDFEVRLDFAFSVTVMKSYRIYCCYWAS